MGKRTYQGELHDVPVGVLFSLLGLARGADVVRASGDINHFLGPAGLGFVFHEGLGVLFCFVGWVERVGLGGLGWVGVGGLQ